MATLVAEVPGADLAALTEELTRQTIPVNPDRIQAGRGRSQAFGLIRRWSYRPYLSRNTWSRPVLWQLLLEFAQKHVPIDWDGIQVNDDYVSAPHTDKGNEGESYTISFGGFTGGELCLGSGEKINTRLRGYLFNGSKIQHWTAPHEGRRFCLVFYKITWPRKFLPRYRLSCRAVPEGLEITDGYNDSITVLNKKGVVVATLRQGEPRAYVGKLTLPGQPSRLPVALPEVQAPDTPASSGPLDPDALPFGF